MSSKSCWGLVVLLLLLPCTVRAGDSGAAGLAVRAEQCQRDLKGETQYASMLHDERDAYEQQAAALIVQRDSLKAQIQEQGSEITELNSQVKALRAKTEGCRVK